MSGFQIVGLSLSLAVVFVLIRSVMVGKSRVGPVLPWLSLWLASAGAMIWPDATGVVARRLGVDRGADLVSYVSVLAMFIGFLWVSVHIRNLNRQITLLVRALAMAEATRSYQPAAESAAERHEA